MKKRRELDALVGNGKSRRKSKSGHELLRNESESSLDEFISSADTKAVLRTGRSGSLCVSCLTVLAFLLLLACIIACAGLIWVHLELKNELNHLRGRMETVESGNLDVPNQIQKIRTQVQQYNKTFVSFKTGKNGFDEVIKNLTRISLQVQSLQSELRSRMVKAEPKDQSLVKELADVGSRVKTLKLDHDKLEREMEQKLEDLTSQLAQIKTQLQRKTIVSTAAPSNRAEDFREMIQAPNDILTLSTLSSQVNSVKQSLQQLNVSVCGQLKNITNDLTNHQSRFMALEKAGSESSVNVTAIEDRLRTQLALHLQQLIQEQNKTGSSRELSKPAIVLLDSIRDQVKNISAVVDSLKMKTRQEAVNGTDQTTLTDTAHQVQDLRTTVTGLNTSVDHLLRLFVEEKNIAVNLSAQVTGIRNYLAGLEIQLEPVLLTFGDKENITSTQTSEGTGHETNTEQRRAADLNEELEDVFA